MAFKIRRIDYYYTTVQDLPGESYKLLSQLASLGVNLLAVSSVPVGPDTTQLTLFPDDPHTLTRAAERARFTLLGPHGAILVQGDDELGALAKVHERLAHVGVNVYATSGCADGNGHYGYLIYVRPEQFDKAIDALEAHPLH